jgi:hypothetical protein
MMLEVPSAKSSVATLRNHNRPDDDSPNYHTYHLAQDGKAKLQGPGWKDDMPWFMTFIDPCGLTAAVTGDSQGERKRSPFGKLEVLGISRGMK